MRGTFHLVQLDNKPAPTKALITLSPEGKQTTVLVKVANSLAGLIEILDGKLHATLSSTGMLGNDREARVEGIITVGFQNGFAAQCAGDTLKLIGEHNTLLFERSVTAERILGEYTLSTYNDSTVPGSDSLKLNLVRTTPGSVAAVAQFKNSLRGELRFNDGLLMGTLAGSTKGSNDAMEAMEKAFAKGMGVGMSVAFDGEKLTLKSQDATYVYKRVFQVEDIVGEYVLKSLNGSPVTSNSQITLDITEAKGGKGVAICAKAKNVLRGDAQISRNLLIGRISSTDAKGSDAEMAVEDALTLGLSSGLEFVAGEYKLKLRSGDKLIIFTRIPKMAFENGKPTFRGYDISKCFKENGNGLLFRIINPDEERWAFYNDTTEYNMRVAIRFGSRSKIRALGKTLVTAADEGKFLAEVMVAPRETELFIEGHVNGYASSYDALPI